MNEDFPIAGNYTRGEIRRLEEARARALRLLDEATARRLIVDAIVQAERSAESAANLLEVWTEQELERRRPFDADVDLGLEPNRSIESAVEDLLASWDELPEVRISPAGDVLEVRHGRRFSVVWADLRVAFGWAIVEAWRRLRSLVKGAKP